MMELSVGGTLNGPLLEVRGPHHSGRDLNHTFYVQIIGMGEIKKGA